MKEKYIQDPMPLQAKILTEGISVALQAFQSSDICKPFSISPHSYYTL